MVTASIGVSVRKAVTDGLAEHFAALSDFNGTLAAERKTVVAFGFDFSNLHREHVYTGRCISDTTPAGMRSGRNARNESGEFSLNIRVLSVSGDAYDAILRAHEIAGQIEDWFADRKSNELGVPGLLTLLCGGPADDYDPIDNGTGATVTLTIRYTSRLE